MSPESPGPNSSFQTPRGDPAGMGFSPNTPVGFIPPMNNGDSPYMTGVGSGANMSGGGSSSSRPGGHPLSGFRGMPMQVNNLVVVLLLSFNLQIFMSQFIFLYTDHCS